MILSDGRDRRYSLADEFDGRGLLECEMDKFFGQDVVVAKLKKLK